MSNLRFTIFLLVLFFGHLMFYQYLTISELYPDLFLVLVVYCALHWGPVGGSISGFLCGIAQDSFSYTYFGLHALAKVLVGFIIGKARHSFFSNRNVVQGTIILVAKLFHDLIFYGVFLARVEASFWHQIIFSTIPSALYTAALGVLIFSLFGLKTRSNRSW
ncbi:MAG: rod shape-determining protein MreD [Candidatus Glassbacteria bacterium]